MDFHATLIRTVIGPLWAGWERSPYLRRFRQLGRTQFDDHQAVREQQWAALRSMVAHAYDTVPFYRERFDRVGMRPSDVRGPSEYRALPVLTKADIRAHGPELVSSRYDRSQLRRKTTSGSTGVSLEVWVDEDSMQWKRARTLRSDEWSGWRFGESVARVWGNPDYLQHGWRGKLRNSLLDRARYLDTLKMDEAAMSSFARSLIREPPSLVFGHAHSIYLLAEYLRATGAEAIRPRGIISTAMVLHPWQRRVIEEVFDCKVTNRYGCEEVSLIACECERHEGLHINSDGVYVEIEREGRPAEPGEAGQVVVTDLTNRGMPMLRYQVGDVAVPTDRICSCGRGFPMLQQIEGREADYVVTARGELVSGISLTENFAMLVPGVAQIQILQEAVDRFVFRIVRGADFGPASEEKIASLVTERFGEPTTYECEYVERIPQEPSGKYRFCISKVSNPFTCLAGASGP